MSKKIVIFILAFLSCVASAGAARRAPLRDGFSLTGIDGKLTSANGKWFFEFDSEVSDDTGRIRAGSIIELLPSTALEKMTADAQKRAEANYRLWGNVTKYKGGNFIFPIYFLPISPADLPLRLSTPAPASPDASRGGGQVEAAGDQNKPEGSPTPQQQKAKISINEPNDVLAIPEEVIGKLKTRRILRHEQLKKGLQLKQDFILASRTALLDKQADGEPELIFDALGRNIQQVSLRLLPCEVLERAQHEQSIEPDPVRFKIAGILTQYKGEYYLLLQKATRAYSHENFGR
jgi:hypothetical protein